MKKIISVLAICILIQTSAFAASIKVVAADSYSTAHPKKTFAVKTTQQYVLENGVILDEGTIIGGQVITIKNPSRGKRDAYFEFVPTVYVSKGETHNITNANYKLRVVDYVPIDKKELAKNASRSAAGFIVPGLSQGISFVQGAADGEYGNSRVTSGLTKVYKDSFVSYVEKGEELQVNEGDLIIMKVYEKK